MLADEMSGLSCLSTISLWAGGGLGLVGVHIDARLVVEVGCAVEELRMTRPAEEVACN